MNGLWMDCSWKSGVLGTCYYGYRKELSRLKELLGSRAVTIVTGARGSGKSEFLRYFLEKHIGKGFVLVDPTEIGRKGRGGVSRAASLVSLKTRFLDAAETAVSTFRAVRLAGEALLDAARHIKGPVVIAVDSVPGGAGDELPELITLASMLTNNPGFSGKVKAIAVIDSQLLSTDLINTLAHLSTGWLTLQGIDDASMAAPLNEYLMGGGKCGMSVDEFLQNIGGLPAYITSRACHDPKNWLSEIAYHLQSTVAEISREAGIDPSKALETACEVLRGEGVDPVNDYLAWFMAEKLVKAGIAYRVMPGGNRFLPSLRYYSRLCNRLGNPLPH
jgi:hypothetical protein